MNNKRRDKLRLALGYISMATGLVDGVRTQEEIAMENIPENLQGTSRYERMEEAVESMDEAYDKLDDAKDLIEEAVGLIEQAIATK